MNREEAIEVYNGLINTKIKEAFEFFAPELRESEDEDERIRKELIAAIDEGRVFDIDKEVADRWTAYLEKQKEQKPVKKEITLTNFEEVLNTFLFDFANSPIEDCEPKEYTKKHSAEILKAAYTELNAQLKQDIFEAQQEGRREGYEAAKAEQKPAEWSEDDEKVVVKKKEEPLTEFEEKLFDIAGIAISLGIHAPDTALVEFVRIYSKDLLELAKKQLDSEYDGKAMLYVAEKQYEKGKRDTMKGLPKWKKTKPERGKAFGAGPWYPSGLMHDNGKHIVFFRGYEISVDELFDKLPKED